MLVEKNFVKQEYAVIESKNNDLFRKSLYLELDSRVKDKDLKGFDKIIEMANLRLLLIEKTIEGFMTDAPKHLDGRFSYTELLN